MRKAFIASAALLIFLTLGCSKKTELQTRRSLSGIGDRPTVDLVALETTAESPEVLAALEDFAGPYAAARSSATTTEETAFTLSEWTSLYNQLSDLKLMLNEAKDVVPASGVSAWSMIPHTPLFESITFTVAVNDQFLVSYAVDKVAGVYQVTSAVALINGALKVLSLP
jgi:hypothetical protein